MCSDFEIQVLEHAVVIVHHARVVAVDEYLGVGRRIDDPHGSVESARYQRIVAVSVVAGIAVGAVRHAEVQVHVPACAIAERTVAVRHDVDAIPAVRIVVVRIYVRAAARDVGAVAVPVSVAPVVVVPVVPIERGSPRNGHVRADVIAATIVPATPIASAVSVAAAVSSVAAAVSSVAAAVSSVAATVSAVAATVASSRFAALNLPRGRLLSLTTRDRPFPAAAVAPAASVAAVAPLGV